MEGVGAQYNPRTVEEVFRDFKGRRAGMVKALTTGFCLFPEKLKIETESLSSFFFFVEARSEFFKILIFKQIGK